MVVGIGIDLVEVARLRRALLRHGGRFERRVFTERELRDCSGRADRDQALAARFAAKEACLKALGTGWSAEASFRDVEVRREESGRPVLHLHGGAARVAERLGSARLHLSLTHQPGVAGAVVVAEGRTAQDRGAFRNPRGRRAR